MDFSIKSSDTYPTTTINNNIVIEDGRKMARKCEWKRRKKSSRVLCRYPTIVSTRFEWDEPEHERQHDYYHFTEQKFSLRCHAFAFASSHILFIIYRERIVLLHAGAHTHTQIVGKRQVIQLAAPPSALSTSCRKSNRAPRSTSWSNSDSLNQVREIWMAPTRAQRSQNFFSRVFSVNEKWKKETSDITAAPLHRSPLPIRVKGVSNIVRCHSFRSAVFVETIDTGRFLHFMFHLNFALPTLSLAPFAQSIRFGVANSEMTIQFSSVHICCVAVTRLFGLIQLIFGVRKKERKKMCTDRTFSLMMMSPLSVCILYADFVHLLCVREHAQSA